MRRQRISAGVVLVLSGYIAFVFIQSLFFKFTNSPETQYIFGTLNAWSSGLGFPGLFAPSGFFSQYVVGSAELVASTLLLLGLVLRRPLVHGVGALMAVGVISGALFFTFLRHSAFRYATPMARWTGGNCLPWPVASGWRG